MYLLAYLFAFVAMKVAKAFAPKAKAKAPSRRRGVRAISLARTFKNVPSMGDFATYVVGIPLPRKVASAIDCEENLDRVIGNPIVDARPSLPLVVSRTVDCEKGDKPSRRSEKARRGAKRLTANDRQVALDEVAKRERKSSRRRNKENDSSSLRGSARKKAKKALRMGLIRDGEYSGNFMPETVPPPPKKGFGHLVKSRLPKAEPLAKRVFTLRDLLTPSLEEKAPLRTKVRKVVNEKEVLENLLSGPEQPSWARMGGVEEVRGRLFSRYLSLVTKGGKA